jgi:hypothetical protein
MAFNHCERNVGQNMEPRAFALFASNQLVGAGLSIATTVPRDCPERRSLSFILSLHTPDMSRSDKQLVRSHIPHGNKTRRRESPALPTCPPGAALPPSRSSSPQPQTAIPSRTSPPGEFGGGGPKCVLVPRGPARHESLLVRGVEDGVRLFELSRPLSPTMATTGGG